MYWRHSPRQDSVAIVVEQAVVVLASTVAVAAGPVVAVMIVGIAVAGFVVAVTWESEMAVAGGRVGVVRVLVAEAVDTTAATRA
jgi:hypothetical protein